MDGSLLQFVLAVFTAMLLQTWYLHREIRRSREESMRHTDRSFDHLRADFLQHKIDVNNSHDQLRADFRKNHDQLRADFTTTSCAPTSRNTRKSPSATTARPSVSWPSSQTASETPGSGWPASRATSVSACPSRPRPQPADERTRATA
ncbi:MAG: hypothetical protein J4F50_10615 [Acidimicrobiia bacterium]|nr:hypothetical protein [Acidimicrobiia bacterium]